MEAFEFDPRNPLNYPCLACHVPAGMSCRLSPGLFSKMIPNRVHNVRQHVASIHGLIFEGYLNEWSEDVILFLFGLDQQMKDKILCWQSSQLWE